ncbi:RNA polymerase sigma factor [Chitinophagaceae bacterium LWZ2-11]
MENATADISLSIIEGCLNNNRKAQEQLYRQFYGFAMVIAMRYSRDEHDAADILSHAFVKVFKSIRSYDQTKGSFHAWLKRIVVNEGLDHIKARHKFISEIEIEALESVSIENEVVEKLSAGEVMNHIRKLPPATHAVFVLYAVEGYNHREIAERLAISEGTSKWHLSEARKKLQQQLLHLHSE